MSRFELEIRVKPRPGLLDPQGKAVQHALQALGWSSVEQVRVGKAIYLELEAGTAADAIAQGESMCRKLLANPVTEDFSVSLASARREVGV